jgi:SAM-dependent methyltransferase
MSNSVYSQVRDYYDANTASFQKHESGSTDAVHRSVWAPGVRNLNDALHYVNQLLLSALPSTKNPHPHVLDLGCGIGGSLFYLAQRSPLTGTGVTLSPKQAQVAARKAEHLGLADRCKFAVASYLELPSQEPPAALAYAVESFVHGPDPGRFFQSAAAALQPGGRLVLCDDFLTNKGAACTPATPGPGAVFSGYLADFRWGWHVHSLITVAEAEQHAAAANLRLLEDQDLTCWLYLDRPWDRFCSLCVELGRPLGLRSEWWRSWVGSHGNQKCLLHRLVDYRVLIFEKL